MKASSVVKRCNYGEFISNEDLKEFLEIYDDAFIMRLYDLGSRFNHAASELTRITNSLKEEAKEIKNNQ